MDIFPLHIFPEGSLAASVTTTVWIGLWIVVFFNLRLGWTASGFVVPGYLAPLLLLRPMSVVVIFVESIITYLLVHTVSERFHCRKPWCSFFGRDRFFALILASILVRIAMDGWLLPQLVELLKQKFSLELEFEQSLHSYGLIIVSLLANCLWKPGLVKGLATNAVTVGLTFLIIRFGLMELTNFNIGNLQYLYEDIASSLLASPKAYIVLITAAFIASWMNLYYGWDFNGILIPALLALQWYEPLKILSSMAEAIIVLCAAILIMRLPVLRSMTIEGSRKTLLFFNVTFAYRILVGLATPIFFPDIKPTDLFGFGYLLSTLLAIKAHQKGLLLRLIRATVQVSAVGTIGGTIAGFLLMFVPLGFLISGTTQSEIVSAASEPLFTGTLNQLVRSEQRRQYGMRIPESHEPPGSQDLEYFEAGLRALQRHLQTADADAVEEARRHLARANFLLTLLEDRYWVIYEREQLRGWGFFVVDAQPQNELLVEVPAPLDEWSTMESGLCLFQRSGAKALSVGGTMRRNNANGSSDVLTARRSMMASFHRLVDRNGTLQVRGYSTRSLNQLLAEADARNTSVKDTLWITDSIPDGVSLAQLKDLLGELTIEWDSTSLPNALRERSWSGFAELTLTRKSRRHLLTRLVPTSGSRQLVQIQEYTREFMPQLLSRLKDNIAPRGSNAYLPPSLEELLFLDEEVLQPILHLAAITPSAEQLRPDHRKVLTAAAGGAAALGYQIAIVADEADSSRDTIVLFETADDTHANRHWGTLIVGFGNRAPQLISVPRPLAERNSFEFGLSLFKSERAQALLIAGSHPHANADGTADVIAYRNKQSVFNLVQQIVQRERAQQPLLSLQVRAFGQPLDADMLLATGNAARSFVDLATVTREMVERQVRLGLVVRYVDGTPETAGYELSGAFLAATAARRDQHEFATLWLSSATRARHRSQSDNESLYALFNALGVDTIDSTLRETVAVDQTGAAQGTDNPQVMAETLSLLRTYLRTSDINAIYRIRKDFPQFELQRLLDPETGQSFLILLNDGRIRFIARLGDTSAAETKVETTPALTVQRVTEFQQGNQHILVVEQPQ